MSLVSQGSTLPRCSLSSEMPGAKAGSPSCLCLELSSLLGLGHTHPTASTTSGKTAGNSTGSSSLPTYPPLAHPPLPSRKDP